MKANNIKTKQNKVKMFAIRNNREFNCQNACLAHKFKKVIFFLGIGT